VLNETRWCNFCNAAPSAGVLEAIVAPGEEPELLDICNQCVSSIPKEKWMNRTDHDK
jgi:hypothetical protein